MPSRKGGRLNAGTNTSYEGKRYRARDCSHHGGMKQLCFGLRQIWDGMLALPLFSCRTLEAWFDLSKLQFLHFGQQGLAIFFFSVLGQRVKIWGFVGHTVSVTMTQICHCSETTAIHNPLLGVCQCSSEVSFTKTA